MSKPIALVVEDHPDISRIFSAAIQEAGYQTEVIRDGRNALVRLAAVVPDIIILDISLPHVSGREILADIRADERLSNTRVMLVTAEHQTADAIRDMADLVLIKPVSYIQLRDLAVRLLANKPINEYQS